MAGEFLIDPGEQSWRTEPPIPPNAAIVYAAQDQFGPENIVALGTVPVYTDDPAAPPGWKLNILQVGDPFTQEQLDAFIADARERWPSLF